MNTTLRTETPALITLMEHWAKTVAKNGGVAAVTIQEGADRLWELETEVERLRKDNLDMGTWIGSKMYEPEWDSFKKSLEVIDHWKTRAEKAEVEVEQLTSRLYKGCDDERDMAISEGPWHGVCGLAEELTARAKKAEAELAAMKESCK